MRRLGPLTALFLLVPLASCAQPDRATTDTGTAGLHLDASATRTVHLHSGDTMILARDPQPTRHGYQPWLLVEGRDGRTLLGSREEPVLPFVHTDGGHPPMTATCTKDGFAVWTSTAHTPPGIVASWDVHRTTYSLEGGRLVPGGGSVVERDVPDPTLRRDRPQMYDPQGLFSDC